MEVTQLEMFLRVTNKTSQLLAIFKYVPPPTQSTSLEPPLLTQKMHYIDCNVVHKIVVAWNLVLASKDNKVMLYFWNKEIIQAHPRFGGYYFNSFMKRTTTTKTKRIQKHDLTEEEATLCRHKRSSSKLNSK